MPEKKIYKAPQEMADLDEISYPVLASAKIDGIRCMIREGHVFSSTMRELPNVQLRTLLAPLLRKRTWVFDGELFTQEVGFGEISGGVRRNDARLPRGLQLHCFDCMTRAEWHGDKETTFENRLVDLRRQLPKCNGATTIKQGVCNNRTEVEEYIEAARALNFEGIILRDPGALYKHGRATYKQGSIYKYKFWVDFDARIVSVHEMRGIREGVERVQDPTGHRRAVHKKGDKEGKDTFGYFLVQVDMPGRPEMQIGNWMGCSDEVRAEIWANPDNYIGQWIRFKAMAVGQKDVPRIPKDVEFRDEKEWANDG